MTFKKILSISIVLVSMLFFSNYAFAISVNSVAVVQTAAITETKVKDIDFGTIIRANQAGTIRINAAAGAATPAVASGNLAVSGGSSGEITIGSNVSASVTIAYPATATLAIGGSSTSNEQMVLNQISTNSTASPLAVTAGTPATVHAGGVLAVKSDQVAGNYTVAIAITFSY